MSVLQNLNVNFYKFEYISIISNIYLNVNMILVGELSECANVLDTPA